MIKLQYIGTDFECYFDEDGDLQEVYINGEEVYIFLSEKTLDELRLLAVEYGEERKLENRINNLN